MNRTGEHRAGVAIVRVEAEAVATDARRAIVRVTIVDDVAPRHATSESGVAFADADEAVAHVRAWLERLIEGA
jgi:hypothetical protein